MTYAVKRCIDCAHVKSVQSPLQGVINLCLQPEVNKESGLFLAGYDTAAVRCTAERNSTLGPCGRKGLKFVDRLTGEKPADIQLSLF